jgi:hypothetical protein
MEGEGITMDDVQNTIVPDQEPEFEKYWDVSETAFQYGKAVGWSRALCAWGKRSTI